MTEKILMFFALAGLGFAIRKAGMLTRDGVRDLIRLNMDICVPALTLVTAATRLTPSMAGLDRGVAGPLLGLPLAAIILVLVSVGIGYATVPLAGVSRRRAPTYVFIIAFANALFLPIPLAYALRGEDGILFVNLFYAGYVLLFWTLGTWMLSGRVRWGFFLHPNLFALLIGAWIGMAGWTIPPLLLDILKVVAAGAIGLALIYSGAVLGEERLSFAHDFRALSVLAVVKLVVLPALTLLAVRAVAAPGPIAFQTVLQASMPVMAQAGIYVDRFGGDTGFASRAAVFTSLLCLVTVPFFVGGMG